MSQRKKQNKKDRKFCYFTSLTWTPAAKIAMDNFFLNVPFKGDLSFEEKLNLVFAPKVRDIDFYKVVKPGKVHGQLVPFEARNEMITPDRNYKPGEIALVRIDEELQTYELQLFTKFSQESEARWYNLKPHQLALFLKDAELIKEPLEDEQNNNQSDDSDDEF